MSSSQGSQVQNAFDLVDVDTMSTAIETVSNTLSGKYNLTESDGVRGTRSRNKERVRRDLIEVDGNIVVHPSPTELDQLLPCIVGGTETTDVFPLAETVPEFDWMIDKGADVYDYADLKVDQATFRGSPGQPLELDFSVMGKTETSVGAGNFPALTFDTDTMFIFTDSAFTYDTSSTGDEYEIIDFELTINNFLERRFGNSTTATSIDSTDRRVTLTTTHPWTSSDGKGADSTGLFITTLAGSDGSLVLTNGGQSLSFAFANMKPSPSMTPEFNGRGELVLRVTWNIYKSGSTNELIITHDSVA